MCNQYNPLCNLYHSQALDSFQHSRKVLWTLFQLVSPLSNPSNHSSDSHVFYYQFWSSSKWNCPVYFLLCLSIFHSALSFFEIHLCCFMNQQSLSLLLLRKYNSVVWIKSSSMNIKFFEQMMYSFVLLLMDVLLSSTTNYLRPHNCLWGRR